MKALTLNPSCPKTQTNSRLARRVFRSSSPRGEPQIWGVSEAMSAIRVLRTRRENTVQQRDATLPGRKPGSRPGPHLDQNVLAGYAAVASASISGFSGGLFSAAGRPCQRPATLFGANVALENRD